MPTSTLDSNSELAIFMRVFEPDEPFDAPEAAEAILAFAFDHKDVDQMNRLAAKNRDGEISANELDELENYVRVGQLLGILQSKARRTLKGLSAP